MDQFEYDGFGLPDSVSPWTSLAGPQPDRRSLLQDQKLDTLPLLTYDMLNFPIDKS